MNSTRRAASPGMSGSRCATALPKSSPYVGHYRHAPPSPVHAELAESLQKLLSRTRKTRDTKEPALPRPLSPLPKNSPFVGYQRHAPQSPRMSPLGSMSPMALEPAALPADEAFSLNDDGPLGLFFLDDSAMNLDNIEEGEDSFSLFQLGDDLHEEEASVSFDPFPALFKKMPASSRKKSTLSLDQYLPHTTLCEVINNIATTKMLPSLLSASRSFHEATRSPQTWQGIPVSIPPAAVFYTEKLESYSDMWKEAEKIMLPRCSNLFVQLNETCPDVPLEVVWRFDSRLKGTGVTVKNNGKTACRSDDDKVVVLGDAPIRESYFEVFLDERDDDMDWENPNDFGLGVTASHRRAREQMKSVEVAGEVPHSWVVDFSKSSIFLVINNEQAAQYEFFGAADIRKGDRVGLLLEPNIIRVYINGLQEASLKVPEHALIEGTLYPVFDLYGRTKQITYSTASRP